MDPKPAGDDHDAVRDRNGPSPRHAGMDPIAVPDTEELTLTRKDLLTADEVATLLRLKRSTALDYMRRGVVPAFKLGRQWYSHRSRLASHLASVPGNSFRG
jgi:excisionase family DNA binding protein